MSLLNRLVRSCSSSRHWLAFMALLLGLLAGGSARAAYTIAQDPVPTSITYGHTVQFGVTVTNPDGSPAPNVGVTWNIPAAITNITWSPTGTTDANGHATLLWSFDAASYGTSSSVVAFVLSPFSVTSAASFTLTAGNSVPGAPTNVNAVAGNASAEISFSPPGYVGSPAVTSYAITASPGGAAGSCASSPCTVTGLTNGTSYTFTVQAVNTAGSSAPSAASNAVTPLSSDATLSALSLSTGTLSPAFTSAQSSYGASVPNGTTSVSIFASTSNSGASYTVNGHAPGTSVPLTVGSNVIFVRVTAQNGTTQKIYVVTVNRAPSSVSTLAALSTSSGALSPAFSTGVTSYDVGIPNSVSSLSLSPTVTDGTAVVRVNGTIVASGGASSALPMAVGQTIVTVLVTAQDGTTTTSYTVRVNRAPSAIATLASLTPSSGTLSPGFSSGVANYAVSVPYGTSVFALTPVLTDTTASVKVNNNPVASGAASPSLPLALGVNDIVVVATAQDGVTTSTYTVKVTRSQAIPAITLVASTTTPLEKVPFTLTATLTAGASPTGTITFKDGGTTIGSAALSSGSASLTLSTLSAGAHGLTAVYGGDTSNQSVTSAVLTVTVAHRPDPSQNAGVRATIAAQVGAARRFGVDSLDAMDRRLERLHEDEADETGSTGAGGSVASTRPASGSGARAAIGNASSFGSLGSGPRGGSSGQPGALAYADDMTPASPLNDEALARFGRVSTPGPSDVQRATQQAASMLPVALDALNRSGKLPVALWASASVGFGKQRADGSADDRFTTTGLSLGFDAPVGPGVKAGLALGLGTDRVDADTSGTRTRARSVSLSVYASWRFMPRTFLDLSFGAGKLAFSSDRYSGDAGAILGGSRLGTNVFGSVGLTREFVSGPWKWAVRSRLDVVSTRLEGYAEAGSPIWALTYDAMQTTSVSSVVGGRVAYTILADWGRLTPTLRVDYRRSLQGSYSQGMQYTDLVGASPGYTLRGDSAARDVFTAGLGMTAETGEDASIDLEYLVSASYRGIDGQRVTSRMRLRF